MDLTTEFERSRTESDETGKKIKNCGRQKRNVPGLPYWRSQTCFSLRRSHSGHSPSCYLESFTSPWAGWGRLVNSYMPLSEPIVRITALSAGLNWECEVGRMGCQIYERPVGWYQRRCWNHSIIIRPNIFVADIIKVSWKTEKAGRSRSSFKIHYRVPLQKGSDSDAQQEPRNDLALSGMFE